MLYPATGKSETQQLTLEALKDCFVGVLLGTVLLGSQLHWELRPIPTSYALPSTLNYTDCMCIYT